MEDNTVKFIIESIRANERLNIIRDYVEEATYLDKETLRILLGMSPVPEETKSPEKEEENAD